MADQDVCRGPLLLVSLPFDVLIEIFKWVPILDMLNLRRVSSHLTSKLANLTTESFPNDGTWALDMQIFRRVVARSYCLVVSTEKIVLPRGCARGAIRFGEDVCS